MTLLVDYVGEVFKDTGDNYIGDFSGGAGYDGETPLGWAHGTSSFYSGSVNWLSPGGLTGLFADFWGNPSDHVHQTIAPVLFEVPTLRAQIVSDPTGPPKHESESACRVELAGDSGGIFTWVGEDASNLAGPTMPPTADSRWSPDNGSVWCFSGWFRLADEMADVPYPSSADYTAAFTGARYAYGTGGTPIISGNSPLSLSMEWQQMRVRFGWSWSSGPALPVIEFGGSGFNHSETHSIDYGAFGHIPLNKAGSWDFADYHWGAVLMKDLHLWNCQYIKPGYHSHDVIATLDA